MKNADRIHEEWQRIEPGDHIHTHPLVPLEVAKVGTGRYIVLRESWTFFLKPLPGGRTRLIVRGLGGYRAPNLVVPPLNFLYWRGVYEPLHFVMERGMMLGLKERAERAWRERPARAGRVGGAEG
jgi:hypothetical protein